jgi:hypothetical protein
MGLQTDFDMATARATMADVPARIDLVTTDPWWNPTAEEQAMGRATVSANLPTGAELIDLMRG